MANPVAYNQGTSIAGSLKSSVISVGVSPSLNISGYNWRNGFENNNIWVIYSDTFSQGQTTQGNAVPTIWGTPVFTDAGLLNLINVLPARAGLTAFTVLSDAIAWLYGENKYFLSNQNYPQIVTENLLGFWDAGFSASYPNVGTVWYNLSTGVNGTLTNGPSWNNLNTKSFFVFDGTDDYCSVGNLSSTNTNYVTVSTFVKRGSDGWNGALFGFGTQASETQDVYFWGGDANRPFGFNTWNGDSWGFNNSTASGEIMDGRWHHLVAVFDRNSITTNSKIYVDGVSKSLSQVRGATQNRTVSTNFGIGLNGWNTSDQLLMGNIKSLFVYNKELDLSEILQNYYQGPIVTSNLSYLWDASNIVSFQSGNSTTFDLTGSGINGTLQNGVGYSNNFGGYWSFDGTDDRILLTNSLYSFTINANTNWTVTAWVRTGTSANGLGNGSVMSNSNGGPVYSMLGINNGVMTYWHYNGAWLQSSGNVIVNDNQWHLLTWVNKSNSTMDMYVDGVLDVSNVNSSLSSNNWIDIIGASWTATFAGDIGSVQVNKGTAMDVSQVTQQYGATRGRFQSYQAYANGGTVTTITENGTTYRVHTFTTSGTLSVVEGGVVEVLVVAGGGGGGVCYGGGGGAGGVKYDNSYDLTAGQSVTVTVGNGGTNQVDQVGNGGPGGNSVFGSITTTGGGYGGGVCGNQGGNGGSGGGGSGTGGSSIAGGNGVAGQGNNGNSSIFEGGGGGGGASSGGLSQNRQGGNGILFSINGTPTYYGGGGSGGGFTLLDGGLGGGGKGGIALAPGVADATTNTGGGGGGSIISGSGTSGLGGSGIVIVRYPIY